MYVYSTILPCQLQLQWENVGKPLGDYYDGMSCGLLGFCLALPIFTLIVDGGTRPVDCVTGVIVAIPGTAPPSNHGGLQWGLPR